MYCDGYFLLSPSLASQCRLRAYVLLTLISYFKMFPLSFDNGLTDRNADYCSNTVDERLLRLKLC